MRRQKFDSVLETEHFTIHYCKGEKWIKQISRALEESYAELVKLFERELGPVTVKIYPDQRVFLKKKGFPIDQTWCIATSGGGREPLEIVSPSEWKDKGKIDYKKIYNLTKHEICHRYTTRKMPDYMQEGIACYISGMRMSRERIRNVIKKTGLYSFRSKKSRMLYREGPSFVGYLVQRYGWKRMERLINLKGDFHSDFKRVYGTPVTKIQKEWKRWVTG